MPPFAQEVGGVARRESEGLLKKDAHTCRSEREVGLDTIRAATPSAKPISAGLVTGALTADPADHRYFESNGPATGSDLAILAFSKDMLRIQEAERTRIAAELHDALGQAFSAMKFCAEGMQRLLGRRCIAEADDLLESLAASIQGAADETRRITMNLHPRLLDDLGLLATLSWFFREYKSIYRKINVDECVRLTEMDIPSHLRITLFRIVQEAFHNISKHANASLARVNLERIEGGFQLAIEDNGTGFDVREVGARNGFGQGFGLTSMRYRSALSGAEFKITSTPGKGTKILVAWPCELGASGGNAA